MRVLIRGKEKEFVARVTCGTCNSVLEISKDDCHIGYDDFRKYYKTNTKCPVCNKQKLYLTDSDFKHEVEVG